MPSLSSILDGPFDAILSDYLKTAAVPGMSLVVLQRGPNVNSPETAFRSYGIAYHDQPVTPEIRFPLCSLTKHIMALALLRLLYEHGMSQDTPVRDVLPEFRLLNEADGKAIVTFAHILSHTSGQGDSDGRWSMMKATDVSLYDYLAAQPCKSAPGTRFSYSNIMYDLTVPAIEALSGESVMAHLAKVFFQLLGMDKTTFEGEGGDGAAEGHYRGEGSDIDGDEDQLPAPNPHRLAHLGSGRLISCAKDMAKWLAYLPTDPFYHLIISPRSSVPGGNPDRPGNTIIDAGEQYGFGLYTGSCQGVPFIEQWGAMGGFAGVLTILPSLDLSFVCLSNSWDGLEVGALVSRLLVNKVMGTDPAPCVKLVTQERRQRMRSEMADFAPVTGLEPAESTRLLGTYITPGVGEIHFDESSNVAIRPQCTNFPWPPWNHGDIKPVATYLGDGQYAACMEYKQWRRDGDDSPVEVRYCSPFRLEKQAGSRALSASDCYFFPSACTLRPKGAQVG
ncbi:beta-lactamase/transpeptidase-like protein [Dioszegia hungarica]|uniref:Beta-lactamase/transpeptidase-like protein n=1 Tax=Dioszegia hungarica TaxID=4972 RepID=A0AA38LZ31_9TREE|nr:beta-lactamase/transpeptidase-like protein [Dioszegia hungarica]KAI9639659.1 beta-lactamase/transpeptidase-like protein [Dioszegia hungarica]